MGLILVLFFIAIVFKKNTVRVKYDHAPHITETSADYNTHTWHRVLHACLTLVYCL